MKLYKLGKKICGTCGTAAELKNEDLSALSKPMDFGTPVMKSTPARQISVVNLSKSARSSKITSLF